jgi:hypothetical protein
MPVDPSRISSNLNEIRSKMAAACARVGRPGSGVRLVAVTKTVDLDDVRALHALGVSDFGENRVQELERKALALKDLGAHWHMIGHLQRNKVRKLLPHSTFIHSLDSVELASEIDRRAPAASLAIEVLIEVNVLGEESKEGVAPDAVAALADAVVKLRAVKLRGLMTMAPIVDDPEKTRPVFAALRELARKMARNLPPGAMSELSMGMTQDFEVAIEEGATLVRIGTALFAAP